MPGNLTFTRLYTSIFATTNIQSFPGNSGGPLYVQADVDKYLPAAICLGGSDKTLVRAINREIVDLINRAEISGNGAGNIVGGGVTLLSPGITAPPFGTGLLTVSLAPSNASSFGPGWRITDYTDTNYITDALATVALIGGGNYPIEFKPVPGFITPSNRRCEVEQNNGHEKVHKGWSHGRLRVRGRQAGFRAIVLGLDTVVNQVAMKKGIYQSMALAIRTCPCVITVSMSSA